MSSGLFTFSAENHKNVARKQHIFVYFLPAFFCQIDSEIDILLAHKCSQPTFIIFFVPFYVVNGT